MGCTPSETSPLLFRRCVCLPWPATRACTTHTRFPSAKSPLTAIMQNVRTRKTGDVIGARYPDHVGFRKWLERSWSYFAVGKINNLPNNRRDTAHERVKADSTESLQPRTASATTLTFIFPSRRRKMHAMWNNLSRVFLTAGRDTLRRKSAPECYFMVDRRRLCHSSDNSNICRVVKLSTGRGYLYTFHSSLSAPVIQRTTRKSITRKIPVVTSSKYRAMYGRLENSLPSQQTACRDSEKDRR